MGLAACRRRCKSVNRPRVALLPPVWCGASSSSSVLVTRHAHGSTDPWPLRCTPRVSRKLYQREVCLSVQILPTWTLFLSHTSPSSRQGLPLAAAVPLAGGLCGGGQHRPLRREACLLWQSRNHREMIMPQEPFLLHHAAAPHSPHP